MGNYPLATGGYASPVFLVDGTTGTSETGEGCSATATFTPAASSHTAGAVVGGAQEFALAAASACVFLITDVAIMISSATAQASGWPL